MANLAEAFVACSRHSSVDLDACTSAIRALVADNVFTDDHLFQLWNEMRLPSEVWEQLITTLVTSGVPADRGHFIRLLWDHVGHHAMNGAVIEGPHRPKVVARAAGLLPLRKLYRNDHAEVSRSAPDRTFASTSDRDVDLKMDDLFEVMITKDPCTLWIGWMHDHDEDGFVQTMQSLTTTADASTWFALDWGITKLNGHKPCALFVFDLPEEAVPRAPTLADALWPVASQEGWHRYFLPAPINLHSGAIRALEYSRPDEQVTAGHFPRREAVMSAMGVTKKQKPRFDPVILKGV